MRTCCIFLCPLLMKRRSALGRRLVIRCSENNVRKLKNRYKFTWFDVVKSRKFEVRKSRDRCILETDEPLFSSGLNSRLKMAYRELSRHLNFELPAPGDRFVLQDLIGEGTYGEVYSARDTATGKCKVQSAHTRNTSFVDRTFVRVFSFYFV
jgi:hypothetical protein